VEGRELPALAPTFHLLRTELAAGFQAPILPSLEAVRS